VSEPSALDVARVKIVVAYDGTDFRGFAANEGVRTVMGVLTAAIATVVRRPVDLTGAGRTDAGVHAWGQVVSGDLPATTDLVDLQRRLNKLCAPDIAVRSAHWAASDFDARFSALWRHYRYEIWNAPAPNPLVARRAWWVAKPLGLWALRAGCDALVGEHDFSSFCRRPKVATDQPAPSMTRRVLSTAWTDASEGADGSLLRFEIRANAFCHQMVRSIVGTLVDIGTGKLAPGAVHGILAAQRREAAGQVAPPTGLTLWEVGYPA
jgi:tRNA pseudouridine38-40 synthase